MSEPLTWLCLVIRYIVEYACIHLADFDSTGCIVGQVELKSEWAELFQLMFIDLSVLVKSEHEFKCATLPALDVLARPFDLAFLDVAVCIAVFSVLYLWGCGPYPLLSCFIQGFKVSDVFQTQHLVFLLQVREVHLLDLDGETERYLEPLRSQVCRQTILHLY